MVLVGVKRQSHCRCLERSARNLVPGIPAIDLEATVAWWKIATYHKNCTNCFLGHYGPLPLRYVRSRSASQRKRTKIQKEMTKCTGTKANKNTQQMQQKFDQMRVLK